MKKGIYKRLLLSLGLVLFTLLLVNWSTVAPSKAAAVDSIVEYSIPVANSQPQNIVAEAPGRMWFTMTSSNDIGRLIVTTPNNPQFTIYPVPTNNSQPYDLAYDGQYIWFTESGANKIGRLNPANGNITEYPIPTPNSSPKGIAIAPNGDVWFVEQAANNLARFTPGNAQFNEYALQSANALPHDVAVADNDTIWITEPGVNKAGRFTVSSQKWLETPTGATGLSPWPTDSIVMDQTKSPWVSAPTKSQIGRYSPGTLAFWRWATTASEIVQPTDLAYRFQNGQHEFWHVSPDSGFVGVLYANTQGQKIGAWARPLPSTSSVPRGITVDTNGHVWITESGSNKIAEWSPPYFDFRFSYLPIILSQ